MGLRTRIAEVAIAAGASILASAFVTTWTLSAKLTAFESGIKTNTESIVQLTQSVQKNQTAIGTIEGVNSTQAAQIAVGDARWVEVQGRLGRIENKVDTLADRRR